MLLKVTYLSTMGYLINDLYVSLIGIYKIVIPAKPLEIELFLLLYFDDFEAQ